ncbi:MAG: plasmid encoded RepA protein [Bacteroidetes bacterium]|nr:plasmid encoded RepA protein [Bacteroidota bacterium]
MKKTHPKTRESIYLGLPYGTKARLIMAHINTEAIKNQTAQIDVEDSMTQFIKRIGLATKGHNYYAVKDQLARIAACVISLEYLTEDRSYNTQFSFVKNYDLWFPKDSRQRVLWPSYIELDTDYLESLMKHAIPLDERALAALSNNAMALDIYTWLAQRLHRVDPTRPQFIPWAALKKQFGEGYGRMDNFKSVFRKTLEMVLLQYRDAKIEEDKNKGFFLKNSPSPIPKSMHLIG